MDYLHVSLILLALLQVKHWFIDFVIQSEDEIKNKGTYLDWRGFKHSLKHGLGTFVILCLFASQEIALVVGCLDMLIHYHIDWLKMNYGNKDITSPKFWNHLGLDQMAHQWTYLLIVFLLV